MPKRSWLLPLTLLVGFAAGYAWRGFPLRDVHAEGELQFEAPQDPAATPTYPPGYYVLSRVYLSDADASLLGKRVFSTGALGAHSHPETRSYPLIPYRAAAASR